MVCKLMHGSVESFVLFSEVGTCGTSKVMGKQIFREKSRYALEVQSNTTCVVLGNTYS